MSIKENLDKIKGSPKHVAAALLSNTTLFFGLVVVFVALSAFGLGRLSAEHRDTRTDRLVPEQRAAVLPSRGISVIESTSATSSPSEGTVESSGVDVATSTGTYVGSKKSDKYHLPWCSGARRISEENKIWFDTKEEAERAGYAPAGNCPGL